MILNQSRIFLPLSAIIELTIYDKKQELITSEFKQDVRHRVKIETGYSVFSRPVLIYKSFISSKGPVFLFFSMHLISQKDLE